MSNAWWLDREAAIERGRLKRGPQPLEPFDEGPADQPDEFQTEDDEGEDV
jgi:hypothetical protein